MNPRSTMACIATVVVGMPGCGEGEPKRAPPPASRQERPAVQQAPPWVREYCADVADVTGPRTLCPSLTPAHMARSANYLKQSPYSFGYTFEGDADQHWVFSGVDREDATGLRSLRPARRLGTTEIHGRQAVWVLGSRHSGMNAGHILLAWGERGMQYKVSAHVGGSRGELRREIRRVAKSMVPAERFR